MFSRTLLFVFCDVVRLERKAVADSQNRVERLLDGICLEFGTLLVRVDFLVLFPVLHKLEINAVMLVDFPLDSDGSADTVHIGIIVAKELIVGVRS